MKVVCIILFVVLSSHILAQQTTSFSKKKQNLSQEILREMKYSSMKLDLYLEKMNSMEQLLCAAGGQPCNCLDLQRKGFTKNGVYTIYIRKNFNSCKAIQVYCNMETEGGGWLVFQRRTDGSENFYRGWNDYKYGFGQLTNEFWLGNEVLYQILNTCGTQYELRIDLGAFDNQARYANYSTFNIADENDNYKLSIGGYSGNAVDSMLAHDGEQFTTLDNDNDRHSGNCAIICKGGWWYGACFEANLNALYLRGAHKSYADGINWLHWKGAHYSLKFTEMKIRPKL